MEREVWFGTDQSIIDDPITFLYDTVYLHRNTDIMRSLISVIGDDNGTTMLQQFDEMLSIEEYDIGETSSYLARNFIRIVLAYLGIHYQQEIQYLLVLADKRSVAWRSFGSPVIPYELSEDVVPLHKFDNGVTIFGCQVIQIQHKN